MAYLVSAIEVLCTDSQEEVMNGWKFIWNMSPNCDCVSHLVCVGLFATPWTVPCQAPLSMEFSRQEYWSGLPFPSPGDLPDPGIEPESPTLQGNCWPIWATREASRFSLSPGFVNLGSNLKTWSQCPRNKDKFSSDISLPSWKLSRNVVKGVPWGVMVDLQVSCYGISIAAGQDLDHYSFLVHKHFICSNGSWVRAADVLGNLEGLQLGLYYQPPVGPQAASFHYCSILFHMCQDIWKY